MRVKTISFASSARVLPWSGQSDGGPLRTLDRVGGAQVIPMLGREVEEGQQRLAVLGQAGDGPGVLGPVLFGEGVHGGLRSGPRLGLPKSRRSDFTAGAMAFGILFNTMETLCTQGLLINLCGPFRRGRALIPSGLTTRRAAMLGRKERDQLELFITGSLRQLIPDDHILVRVDCVLDLGWLRDEVSDLYCPDNGRPGIDPEVAVRLMLVGFMLGLVHDPRATKCPPLLPWHGRSSGWLRPAAQNRSAPAPWPWCPPAAAAGQAADDLPLRADAIEGPQQEGPQEPLRRDRGTAEPGITSGGKRSRS
jgi:hypothetical protein